MVCATVFGVAGVAFLVVMFLLDPMIDGPFAMFADTWQPVTLYAYLPLVAVAFIALRGRASAISDLTMIVLLGLPGILGGAVGLATVANQYLDQSTPQTVQVVLVSKYKSSGGRNNRVHYYFVFQSWRSDRAEVKIPVSAEHHSQGKQKQTWILRTRTGRFGYEWIESLSLKTNTKTG